MAQKTQTNRYSFFVRALSVFLALLMIGGSLAALLQLL